MATKAFKLLFFAGLIRHMNVTELCPVATCENRLPIFRAPGVKLRLPIREIYRLFRSLVYFILPFTDVRNFSDQK